MVQSKILCDVCGQEVEHTTKLSMINTFNRTEVSIPCLCESCVSAINDALDRRQHLRGVTVQPYDHGMQEPYRFDDKGNKIPRSQIR